MRRRALSVALAIGAIRVAQAAADPQGDCAPGAAARVGVVASVEDGLELTLADRLRLRLVGVEPPGEALPGALEAKAAREALRRWLEGRPVAYEPVGVGPDRWGRMAAFVAPRDADGPALAVAPALVDAGLARARAEPSARTCLARLLALEAGARAEPRGVWTDAAFGVLDAADRAALGAHEGALTIVEGRVASVGRTTGRVYVNFGPIRGVDFAAIVATKTLKTFEAAGIAPERLVGARLRVRGLLDMRFGPQIELFDPAALEIVEPRPASPQSGPLARQ